MTKPTLHFAYTIPASPHIARRALDKILGSLHIKPLYRGANDFFIPWQKPIRSPHCISYHLLKSFKEKYRVKFYNIYEHTLPDMKPQDIFIGQPVPEGGFGAIRSTTDDKQSVTSRAIREYPNNKSFLIMPYTHDPLYVSWTKDLISSHRGGLILVGGKIWERNWEKSPLYNIDIKNKIHVAMGIDTKDYPRVKTQFNPKGKRKYLYIGHTGWYKNTVELERIAARIPNFQGAHIGSGNVKGWKKIADFATFTPEFMTVLAKEYDIFVNTSTGDPQATTILEQMCFGLIVACTLESGYDHPSLIKLSTCDTGKNIEALEGLQYADEEKLLARAWENRRTAEHEHSWEKFCEAVTGFVNI